MKTTTGAFLLCCGLLAAVPATATTYHVDGSISATYTDADTGITYYKTIAEGVAAAAQDYDVVEIAAGTYSVSATINLTHAMTVRGATGNPADVTVDGLGTIAGPVFKFSHSGAIVADLRIYRGGAYKGLKGSVHLASGGTLSNCIVEGSVMTGNTIPDSVGIYIDGGGLVTGCVVKNCRAKLVSSNYAVGVRIVNGTLENTLVTSCYREQSTSSVDTYGVVYLEKGTVRNCTIAGNTVSHYPLWVKDSADCTVVDTIAWGNTALRDATSNGRPNCSIGARANVSGLCTTGSIGVNPIDANPCFTDAANGDYSLMPGSPCIGAGANGGDIGCIPFDASAPALGVKAGAYRGTDSLTTALTLTACGYDLTGATVTWAGLGETGAAATHTFGPGTYSLTANVVLADSTALSVTLPDAVRVSATGPMYVDASSATPAFPYATPATAATSLDAALAYAGSGTTIYVTNGTYTLAKDYNICDGVRVIGTGDRDRTILKAANSSRLFFLGSADALLANLWMQGGSGVRSAAGVWIGGNGGTVSNCVIHGCQTDNNVMDGSGIRMSAANARVVRSKIMNCGSSYGKGAGVYIESGTLADCLVLSNKAWTASSKNAYGGGVYLATSTPDARVVNCTVSGNVSYYGGGIYRAANAGYVCNTIVYGNTSTTGDNDINAATGNTRPPASCFSNTCSSAEIGVNPQTVSAAPYELPHYNLSATAGAACIDKGDNALVAEGLDYAGNLRIFHGTVDIGAFEYCQTDVTPGFTADRAYAVGAPARFVFTASVQGADIADCTLAWHIDGSAVPAGTEAVLTNDLSVGRHDVRLVVTADGADYEHAEEAFVTVFPAVLYADAGSTGSEWPYDTPAKAATNLNDAVDDALREGGRLLVAAGTYDLSRTLVVGEGQTITGAGRDATVLNGMGAFRVMTINGTGAYVEGLCVSNGANARGSGVYIYGEGGTFADGRIAGCVGIQNQSGGGALIVGENSKVTRCVVSGNRTLQTAGNHVTVNYGGGGVVVDSFGVLENSLVTGNRAIFGAGVLVDSYGIVRNCTIVGNTGGGDEVHGGCGGVKANLDVAWGTIDNCIVRDNVDLSLEDPGDIRHNVVGLSGMFRNNAFPSAHGTACVTDDPLFRNAAGGDYRILSGSPCRNAGLHQPWMEGATDFFGNRRARSGKVDIGFHQTAPTSTRVFVR